MGPLLQLAAGVNAIVVKARRVDGRVSYCFHICHLDGSVEDFSYRKCLTTLFSGEQLDGGAGERVGTLTPLAP
jgi:hypothetical protein